MILVILMLLILSVMGIATVFLAGTGTELSASSRMQDQAFRASEAGINYGVQYVQTQPNPTALINGNFATAGYGGTMADPNILDAGSTVTVAGAGGSPVNVHAAFKIGQSYDSQGQAVKCGLVGFSDSLGQPRFSITSRGYGPGLATSEVEAHVFLPPQPGACPPSTLVAGGYSGS